MINWRKKRESEPASPTFVLPPSPEAPFNEITITRTVLEDRCFSVGEGNRLRIYLALSEPPPLGWSFLFAGIWHTMEYEDKARAGVDEDAVWVECVAEDLRTFHLPELKRAVARTNESFVPLLQQKAIAEQEQRELGQQAQAKIRELKLDLEQEGRTQFSVAEWITRVLRKVRGALARLRK